jgi:hypothetical protein
MTPTARSLAYLRKQGYLAAVVERFNSYTKRKNDLWGFVDIVAIKDGKTIGVQTTSSAHVADRIAKIRAHENCAAVLACWTVIVHGWAKRGPRGKRKVWTLREEIVTG